MIVENQSNLKVHFAGAESSVRARLISSVSKYSLFTIFPFLCDQFGIKHGYQDSNHSYSEIANFNYENTSHCIQDSGLFSLMFGSFQAPRTLDFVSKWYEALVQTTIKGGYQGTVVEVDCQKILGVEAAWDFREKMNDDLPNRIINVFHVDDGQKGLDRLIEFSDYIAISLPELRAIGRKNYAIQLAHYIKNKKPEIDIHLLGCTENKLLKELSFCSSADSTSWVSFNKFGHLKYNDGRETKSQRKADIDKDMILEKYQDIVKQIMIESGKPPTQSIVYYHSCDLLQLELMKNQYSHYAGNQS